MREINKDEDFDMFSKAIRQADKEYLSFRLLNSFGLYFQGIEHLLISIERYLKIIYALENNLKVDSKQTKEIRHNIEDLIKKTNI
ncbi:MAG: hypothetical protein ACMXYB_02140 [Candidatus Woesearchaeota archaeon]